MNSTCRLASIGTCNQNPVRIMGARTLGVADAAAAPEIEAGTQTLSVPVNGSVKLNPTPGRHCLE